MNKIILTIFSLILTTSVAFCSTTKAYDKYGSLTGSYKTNGSVTTSYDRNGSKTGTIKHTSNSYTTYDKYGSKTGTAKKTSTGYTPMTNTVLKQARIKLIRTEQQQNTINTVKRQEH